MATLAEHQANRALLRDLRARGLPSDLEQADKLQTLYHAREMEGIADDVYDAAKGESQPEPGWLRASEHLDELREVAPQLRDISDDQLREYLKPRESGFRAEIYIPDAAILGPGYKPVISVKGSSGEVLDAHAPGGKRDTTMEDFLANNFPQSVGLESDYYTRGMSLAKQLHDRGFDFELSAHSLGGGVVSAMSAVSGKRATTWNSAGLHPETVQRFAANNRGVKTFDTNNLVIAYMVQGELLNDGIQKNIDRLDSYRNYQLAGVLKETSQLLQSLPEGRALFKSGLDNAFPPSSPAYARDAVSAFVDKLAYGNTAQLLRELPLAAGTMKPALSAMTEQQGRFVKRVQTQTLADTSNFAGPILSTLHATALGAHTGRQAGELVATGGKIVGASAGRFR